MATYGITLRSRYATLSLALGAAVRTAYKYRVAVTTQSRGKFRIANDADDRYELYRGVDALADLDSSPWDTFTTLPHTTAALTPPMSGSTAYHFVLRKRNRWGLVSLNASETIITIAADGSPVGVAPSNPSPIAASAAAAGTVLITGRYAYLADGDRQADTWLVYLTFDGSAPDPDLDTPVEVAMSKVDGVARLNYTTDPQTEGTVVKAVVRVRRSDTPAVDSINTLAVSATATLLGPQGELSAGLFLGASRQI